METWEFEYLNERVKARDDYLQGLIECPKTWLFVYDGVNQNSYAMILHPAFPICVGESSDDPPTDASIANRCALTNFVDWDLQDVVRLPYDNIGSSYQTAVNNYLDSLYSDVNRTRLYIGTFSTYHMIHLAFGGAGLLDNFGNTQPSILKFNALDVYKKYHQFFAAYDAGAQSSRNNPASPGRSNSVYDSAWSELSWPELEGYKTAYINNVGCFIPDYMDIDFNLSHSLGSSCLGAKMIRAPNSEIESTLFKVRELKDILEFLLIGGAQSGAFAGGQSLARPADPGVQVGTSLGKPMIMGGSPAQSGKGGMYGGIAQGIINTYNFGMNLAEDIAGQARFTFPRIRAFGRQVESVSYTDYMFAVKRALGGSDWNSFEYDGRSYSSKWWNSKIVFIMARDSYDSFIEPLREYIESRGGVIV